MAGLAFVLLECRSYNLQHRESTMIQHSDEETFMPLVEDHVRGVLLSSLRLQILSASKSRRQPSSQKDPHLCSIVKNKHYERPRGFTRTTGARSSRLTEKRDKLLAKKVLQKPNVHK